MNTKDEKGTKKGDKALDPVKDAKAIKAAKEAAKKQRQDEQTRYNELKDHWEGSVTWARIFPASSADALSGTILSVGFRIDMLSAIMFVMVTFIASLIHLFSIGYMADELQKTVEDHEVHTAHGHYERRGRFGRFFMFLSLFCFSMLNLVLADNLFQIFVSWELVGICSFLLIGFYFERTSASNAANKAFITNRIGDAGFIIGLMKSGPISAPSISKRYSRGFAARRATPTARSRLPKRSRPTKSCAATSARMREKAFFPSIWQRTAISRFSFRA